MPSLEELNNLFQRLQETIEKQQETIEKQEEKINSLEDQVKERRTYIVASMEELANQLQQIHTQVLEYREDILVVEHNLTNTQKELEQTNQELYKTKQQFPPGTEIIREIHPLNLATNGNYVDVGEKWTPITHTVYHLNEYTKSLPNSERKYRLVIRQGNNGQRPPDGKDDKSRYRLYYTLAKEDGKEYPGKLNWGDRDCGSWDIFTLDYIKNPVPFNPKKHLNCQDYQMSYWQLQGSTSGCTNRVHSVILLIVDVLL